MAEKHNYYNDLDLTYNMGTPRGRGAWLIDSSEGGVFSDGISQRVGQSQFQAAHGRGLNRTVNSTPVGRVACEGPYTSTPGVDGVAIDHLTDMIGQLGSQIGESIVAKLMSAGLGNVNAEGQTSSSSYTQTPTHTEQSTHTLMTPQLTVHMKSEHDTFRGDGSDKYGIEEWVDRTKSFLRRQMCPIQDQAEEIMCRLAGKAKDIVKISIRSDATLNVTAKPELIYSILMKYFSEAPSCLPLADFYATLPGPKENPVDYWIRLNKAADLANEGLLRQGKHLDNIEEEVTRMFIKFCPDPCLSNMFRCKPIQEWNAKEIQCRIDDYQREFRSRGNTSINLRSHTTTMFSSGHDMYDHSKTESPVVPKQTFCLSTDTQVCHQPGPTQISCQSQHQTSSCSPPAPMMAQSTQPAENQLLTRMVEMMERLMDKVQERDVSNTRRDSRQRRNFVRTACRVCNDSKHTTVTHCMMDKLCFACFSPGHNKNKCPKQPPVQSPQEGN
nr:uncharacterized protein LOC103912040 [Danio rerio]|eukprot:XP_021336582.1 uncharacterized protein LOC103912040 [Danio rerio]